MPSARALALRVLQRWDTSQRGTFAEHLISQEANRHSLGSRDRAQVNSIVLGCLRNRTLLDHWLGHLLANKSPQKLKPDLRRLLQVALFDLIIQKGAPHAAVSEAVSLAPKAFKSLTNAILRRADRERDMISEITSKAPLQIRFSHPKFIVDEWQGRFGRIETAKLLEWNNSQPEYFQRTNRLHPDNSPGPLEICKIASPDVGALDSGRVYAQDPSTAAAPILLAPKPGEAVLDTCAAPGGKTALLAELMGNSGQIIATDSSPRRLKTLTDNLHRLKVSNTRVIRHDWAGSPCPELGKFDAILLDVPCSNTGVFRRRVDARWRISKQSISELNNLQLTIANNAIAHLKPGGRLVYSTCSIEPAENLDLVNTILTQHPELSLSATRESLPHVDATDGAFAALFVS